MLLLLTIRSSCLCLIPQEESFEGFKAEVAWVGSSDLQVGEHDYIGLGSGYGAYQSVIVKHSLFGHIQPFAVVSC